MSEPSLSMTADDDLPRTIRREREARDREARERAAVVATGPTTLARDEFALPAPAATVTDFDIPFTKLVMFFVKAVFAAVPALLLLTVMLWLFGQGLKAVFPQLLQMKVDIQVYSPKSEADFRKK
jgi:hypothetical protein